MNVKDMLASLKTKASNRSLLPGSGRTSSSTTTSARTVGDASEEERRGLIPPEEEGEGGPTSPALPMPDVVRPFPVVEQPSRVVFSSRDAPHFEETFLTSTRSGTVTVAGGRGEREQFLLVPVAADADADGDDEADGRPRRKDSFYLRSYKFHRYLTSDSGGAVRTVDFSKGNDDGDRQQRVNKPGESEEWLLARSPHGGHHIVSARNGSNVGCRRGGESLRISLGSKNDRSESWDVEFVSGELCFLSSPPSDSDGGGDEEGRRQQVRCDLAGRMTLTDDRRGWEVWRFVEAGAGKVRVVSWMHPFCVACTHEGRVSAVGVGRAEEMCDEWTVEKAPGGRAGVVLRSAACARRVLARGEGGGLTTTQELEGTSGVWQLDAAHSQMYTLTSRDKGGSLGPFPYVTENLKQSDQVVLQQIDEEGTVRMYHKSRGQYLRSVMEGEVTCDSNPPDDADPSDLWKMEPRDGGYVFASKLHNQLLACTPDEANPKLCTIPSAAATDNLHVWDVNPTLPRAVSSAKIKTFALGTSIAVGTTVAMPFLMAGMLAVVPAEATLAASLLSVGLTSAEAIASVGAIGATAAIVFREESDTLGMDSERGDEGGDEGPKGCTKRPLCGWRSW